jgi:lipoprotein-anchoring transpeptidase ErfK/SrfK
MKHTAPLAGAAMAAVLLTGTAALADPSARSGGYTASAGQSTMGGGFIEMLMTGRNPGRAQSYSQQPAYPQQAAQPQPQPYPQQQAYQAYAPAFQGGQLPMEPQPAARPYPGQQQAALNPDYRQVERTLDPMYLPQVVDYAGSHSAGTIVIDTPNKFMYLVEGNGRARRYGIGVGRPGFEWAGVKTITRKAEWPDWRPPPEMIKRRPDLPRYMAGGPENPMGARGLYLGSSLYRIHGTNEPHTIGQAVSSGCIRMRNEDVTDLYGRVRVGTKVIVM